MSIVDCALPPCTNFDRGGVLSRAQYKCLLKNHSEQGIKTMWHFSATLMTWLELQLRFVYILVTSVTRYMKVERFWLKYILTILRSFWHLLRLLKCKQIQVIMMMSCNSRQGIKVADNWRTDDHFEVLNTRIGLKLN